MRLMPGSEFRASTTPMGNVPIYKANGLQSLFFSIFLLGALTHAGVLEPGRIYDMFGELLSAINLFALVFCFLLTIKGYTFPSSSDAGSAGNFVKDYFWGTELHPRIFGFDVKQFTNCRFGMMFWALGIIAYAHAQYMREGYVANSMVLNVLLQLIYITKFFWWEMGYMCTMDIQHDRAGFYLCWGCLVWLPMLYTSHSYYLVAHPVDLDPVTWTAIFLVGVGAIWCNYDIDRQRQEFRATNGRALIWGEKPAFIRAQYTTGTSRTKRESLLLLSGWWGLSRHFHYVPEITAAFCWSLPALFDHPLPYVYVFPYLTILLVDRAFRDDERCAKKYGPYWDQYCKKVPYKIVPGVL